MSQGGESGPDVSVLKRDSVRGAATTFASQSLVTLIQLTSTVVLARLLTPDDYGVMAMVATAMGVAALFRDMGLSAAAVQEQSLSCAQQSNLFWLNLGVGAALAAMVAVLSPGVAWFYGRRELTAVAAVLSLQFLVGGAGAQFGASLIREFRFGRHSAAGIAGSVVSLGLSVVLARAGHAYWSLVWGNLAGSLTTTALLAALSSFRPGPPSRRSGVRRLARFGSQVVAFDLANYFARNFDNILIGRVWGSETLGLYGRAYALLMFPITSLRGPVMAVAFPALSRLRDQPQALRSYYCKVTTLVGLLTMPLVAFLFVASELVIAVVLGERWLGVAAIFSYLALAAFIQPVWGLAGSLMLGLGQGARHFQCGLMNAVLVCASFLVGVRWGATGVAAAYSVATYLGVYPNLWWALRESPVSFRDLVRAVSFPALVSGAVAAVAFLLRSQLAGVDAHVQLAVLGLACGLTMVAAVFGLPAGANARALIADVRDQLRARRA